MIEDPFASVLYLKGCYTHNKFDSKFINPPFDWCEQLGSVRPQRAGDLCLNLLAKYREVGSPSHGKLSKFWFQFSLQRFNVRQSSCETTWASIINPVKHPQNWKTQVIRRLGLHRAYFWPSQSAKKEEKIWQQKYHNALRTGEQR